MAKPGPKPKAGDRYPDGRLKPAHLRFAAPPPPPAAIRRTMQAALRAASDPRWGTMIGRLRLERELTDRQFGAAEAYGRLRSRFDKMMGLPRRSARSCFYDVEAGRTAAEMTEPAIVALRQEHARLLSGVDGGTAPARHAIDGTGRLRVLDPDVAEHARRARAGRMVMLLDRIILDDEAPLPGELPLLLAGLDALVALFKIGEGS